ncbi:MAG: hypothetical protein ACRCUE_00425 [Bosea sp. (in: a-proteobacteria)]
MTQRFSAACLAMALVFGPGAGSALAQSDGPGFLGNGILSLFGLGAGAPPPIDYRERPPLVVPPKSSLPSPQERANARAGNWPNDPDIERRRRDADARNEIFLFSGAARAQRETSDIRLSPDELARGRIAGRPSDGQPINPPNPMLDDRGTGLVFDPIRQMRDNDLRRNAAAQELPVGVEPPRRNLSQPPTGLRGASQRVASPADARVERDADRNDLGIRNFQRGQN